MKKLALLIVVIVAEFCTCGRFPSTFKKCNKKQSDVNECLSVAIKDAVGQLTVPKKEIGAPSFEPLEVPAMVIGAGTGAVQFSQNYTDVKVWGLTKLSTMDAKMDFEKNILKLDYTYPQCTMEFQYDIKGRILVLPIIGNGPGQIILDQPRYRLAFYLEEYEKKNKKYYKVTNATLSIEPKRLHIKLDNLFNGDKVLGDNILQVMNDNWKEVFADVKPSYDHAYAQIFSSIFSNLLNRVPISDLFEDK